MCSPTFFLAQPADCHTAGCMLTDDQRRIGTRTGTRERSLTCSIALCTKWSGKKKIEAEVWLPADSPKRCQFPSLSFSYLVGGAARQWLAVSPLLPVQSGGLERQPDRYGLPVACRLSSPKRCALLENVMENHINS